MFQGEFSKERDEPEWVGPTNPSLVPPTADPRPSYPIVGRKGREGGNLWGKPLGETGNEEQRVLSVKVNLSCQELQAGRNFRLEGRRDVDNIPTSSQRPKKAKKQRQKETKNPNGQMVKSKWASGPGKWACACVLCCMKLYCAAKLLFLLHFFLLSFLPFYFPSMYSPFKPHLALALVRDV